jgi:hypothetical protein
MATTTPTPETSRKARTFLTGACMAALVTAASMAAPLPAMAGSDDATQAPKVDSQADRTYSEAEVVDAAGDFFGGVSEGLAKAVHRIFAQYGQPNAYIKGEEASGAFVIGLRYGQGDLVMKQGGNTKVYWQGPSAGWDFGGDAVKVFTLVYNLPNTDAIYKRFPGVEGSAYLVGGIGVNYQQRGDIVLAPMRSGVGIRLGASVGYLNYSREREWLPF